MFSFKRFFKLLFEALSGMFCFVSINSTSTIVEDISLIRFCFFVNICALTLIGLLLYGSCNLLSPNSLKAFSNSSDSLSWLSPANIICNGIVFPLIPKSSNISPLLKLLSLFLLLFKMIVNYLLLFYLLLLLSFHNV